MAQYVYTNQWIPVTGTGVAAQVQPTTATVTMAATPQAADFATTEMVTNALFYDFSGAYTECINELDSALKTTKSQKLRESITACMNRLQQLRDLSDSLVKRCQSLEEQLQTAQSRVMAYSVDPSGEVTLYETTHDFDDGGQADFQDDEEPSLALSRPQRQTPQRQRQQRLAASVKRKYSGSSPSTSMTRISAGSSPKRTLSTSAGKVQPSYRPNLKRKQSDQQAEKENQQDDSFYNFNADYVQPQFDKEDLAREALERAENYDFGEITSRYTREAIMDMVDSSARESVRAFVTHGMLTQFNDPNNDKRLSYRCNEPNCNLKFGNHLSAFQHCLKAHMNSFRPCACGHCDAKYYLKLELGYHQSNHTGVYRFTCPKEGCTFKCNKRSDYRFHMATHDPNKKSHPCPDCNKLFNSERAVARHRLAHQGREYPCKHPGCNKVFPHKDSLRNHQRSTHRAFKCKICEYVPNNFQDFKTHMASQHDDHGPWESPASKERMNCEKCGLSLLKRNYKEHLEKQVCNKVREVNGQLRIVHQSHTPKDPSSCPHCSQIVSKQRLRKHIRKYHPEHSALSRAPTATIYKCTVCERELNRKSFRGHFLKRHSDLEYYPERAIRLGKASQLYEAGDSSVNVTPRRKPGAASNKELRKCSVCKRVVGRSKFKDHFTRFHPEEEYSPDKGLQIKEDEGDVGGGVELRKSPRKLDSKPASLEPNPLLWSIRELVKCSVCLAFVREQEFKEHFTKAHPRQKFSISRALNPLLTSDESDSEDESEEDSEAESEDMESEEGSSKGLAKNASTPSTSAGTPRKAAQTSVSKDRSKDFRKCSVCQQIIRRSHFKEHFVKHHPTHEYYPERAIRDWEDDGGVQGGLESQTTVEVVEEEDMDQEEAADAENIRIKRQKIEAVRSSITAKKTTDKEQTTSQEA